jgi:hypothetical protein
MCLGRYRNHGPKLAGRAVYEVNRSASQGFHGLVCLPATRRFVDKTSLHLQGALERLKFTRRRHCSREPNNNGPLVLLLKVRFRIRLPPMLSLGKDP